MVRITNARTVADQYGNVKTIANIYVGQNDAFPPAKDFANGTTLVTPTGSLYLVDESTVSWIEVE